MLVFQIDSVINVTKDGETKIYKAVEELKNLVKENDGNKEVRIDKKLQSNLNSLIENTLEKEKKWKKTSISSLIITLVNQKKKIWDEKNKTVQHGTNKITKLLD